MQNGMIIPLPTDIDAALGHEVSGNIILHLLPASGQCDPVGRSEKDLVELLALPVRSFVQTQTCGQEFLIETSIQVKGIQFVPVLKDVCPFLKIKTDLRIDRT